MKEKLPWRMAAMNNAIAIYLPVIYLLVKGRRTALFQ